MTSTRIQHRIDPKLKIQAETILEEQGIRPSQAITIFYTEITRVGGFPFLPSQVPNKQLVKDLKDAKKGTHVKKYKTKKTLFHSLGKL